MRDRLASLIVVKQEATASLSHSCDNNNNNDSNNNNNNNNNSIPIENEQMLPQQPHQTVKLLLPSPAIKCQESLYTLPYESNIYYEVNNNCYYRQNLNTDSKCVTFPAAIYPCRNLFPDGCDIGHLACSSGSSGSSVSSVSSGLIRAQHLAGSAGLHSNSSSCWHSNGTQTCMYERLPSILVMVQVVEAVLVASNYYAHVAYVQHYAFCQKRCVMAKKKICLMQLLH
ncbi:hypothetical protein AWZ03_011078 [Drosophila navojoa]|uniref:Uncharacterized protein n=1 Tax=Drosophila navojoa TaxID=7232 RepID=A0A484B1B3_DRONA|nr:probable nuclear hormone receptor HR38 [Drosophila navojoa]TDG42493.1 hypothetical protein AWZ03_011078 [Drosophila navojoa]